VGLSLLFRESTIRCFFFVTGESIKYIVTSFNHHMFASKALSVLTRSRVVKPNTLKVKNIII